MEKLHTRNENIANEQGSIAKSEAEGSAPKGIGPLSWLAIQENQD